MPAINVARTDTFEVQRQKINEIGANLFQISQGGSDLSTGNLKLGDGTRESPSLAFINESNLGIYRPETGTIGIINGSKKTLDFTASGVYSFKDILIQQKVLDSGGVAVSSIGAGYDSGTYTAVPLTGGTGDGATADVTVLGFAATLTNEGAGYDYGVFSNIDLTGGTGTGAQASFTVPTVTGSITNPGSGYTYDVLVSGFYQNVPVRNGSGVGAVADVAIDQNGEIISFDVTDSGTGYQFGDVLGVNAADVGGTGSGFAYTVSSYPETVQEFSIVEYGDGYTQGDILSIPGALTGVNTSLGGEITGVSTTLSDLSPQITVASTTNINVGMEVINGPGDTGFLNAGTTVASIDSPTTLTLSSTPSSPGAASLTFTSPLGADVIEVSSIVGIFQGSTVTQTGGNGVLPAGTTVSSVDEFTNTVTLSAEATTSGSATLTFTPPYGIPSTNAVVTVDSTGIVDSVTISNGGNGYSVLDTLTTNPANLTQPITYQVYARQVQEITFVPTLPVGTFSVGDLLNVENDVTDWAIVEINTSGGNITSILAEYVFLSAGDNIVRSGQTTPTYEVATVGSTEYRFYIDTGSGQQLTPNLTLYVGSKYTFDYSDASNSAHIFSLSQFRDGIWSPSYIQNVSATVTAGSADIVVSSSTGILPGMSVELTQILSGTASIPQNVTVEEVNGTTITLSSQATQSGTAEFSFRGVEYTDGVVRTSSNTLEITVTENTPTLYYYCATNGDAHQNMGGTDNQEAVITIDPNNPKVFGSGFELSVVEVTTTDVIAGDVETGDLTAVKFVGQQAEISNATISTLLNAPNVSSTTITTSTITSTGDLTIGGSEVNVDNDLNIGSSIQLQSATGDILTTGDVEVGRLEVDNTIFIDQNTISSTSGVNLQLQPANNQIVSVLGTTAFAIPAGNTGERPTPPAGQGDGYIRFNNETNQYEGYSNTNQQWSSLGGVRDLDGNTTILAEETVGANDNTLWFINDNVNTLRVTPSYLEFVNVKKVKSPNLSAPTYSNWVANEIVALGDYIKYRNNIYEVTAIPADPIVPRLATSGGEPTHDSGSATNGNVTLTYFTTAVSSLTFDEISEIQVDPLGFTDLVVNGELRFSNNTISSTVNDIIVQPVGSQKVTIDSASSLVIPVGDNNSKGNPAQGSIRYNTDDQQFEGFNGTQWGGLGGVKDVDQDTKITAESSPGSDEDVLAFFNANNNTVNLTTTQLELNTVDTIASTGSGDLNFNASIVTFNNLETTLDNSSTTVSFLSTTKDNLDFGLSTGILNDHLVRFTNTGEIVYNLGFGTGTPDNLVVLNDTLTNFELSHIKTNTSRLSLERGTLNSGNATVYSPSTEASAKVFVTAHNTTTGDKEIIEYFVIDNGTDIFFTETNNIKTGSELISVTFDFDPVNNVRIGVTLDTGLTVGDNLSITIIKTITKR